MKDTLKDFLNWYEPDLDNDNQNLEIIVSDYLKTKNNPKIITSSSWVKITEKLPEINDNIQILVKINIFPNMNYEIARYTKWGFHYGTRNTQDMIPIQSILEWRYIQE